MFPAEFRFIDGPLVVRRHANSNDVVEAMAKDLIEFEAFGCEGDAIRSLIATGRYSSFEVVRRVDDARQLAMNESVVVREMSDQ